MDWKYILSMAQSADDLEESKKDELLNTIAWYDFTEEKIDAKKHKALLFLCQEIMKYKSEQVEALLAELDEIAMKHAEDEARTRESDDRSSRSKKSIDSDEQETRYRDLKAKYRKLQKHIDSNKEENEQLKQNIKMLEQERVYLQKEIRNSQQRDDSASDISETVKDQQRNLMESVQHKNTQITQLLTDIENVESDNLQLRAHLSSLREDLSDATEKLDSLINDNKLLQIQLDDTQASYSKVQLAINSYKEQVDDMAEEKQTRELEFEQFASEIDARIEDWKLVLEAKNKEIDHLKSKTNQSFVSKPLSSADSTSIQPEDEIQLNVLQKALVDREDSIIRLQKQLEKATKEMLKSTQVLKQVTKERDTFIKKCDKLNVMSRDLKKQLRATHQRCQELSGEIEYQEKLLKEKDIDINKLVKDIQDPKLQKVVKELEEIKNEKRSKERKVADLVRSCNKLRSISDNLEKENVSLRERLGLTEDDFVSTKCINVQQKRNKKLFDELKNKLEISEEEKLQYRMEVQKLSKVISSLSDQLLDVGETPVVDGQEINVTNMRSKKSEELEGIEEKMADATKSEYNALLEENDALRKGLHEILESIQINQEKSPREIKSDTLESLLRALDAKHVSGWYHPAMRLQAEVHTLQGRNTTLREQLRIARDELDTYKERAHLVVDNGTESSNAIAIANLHNHILNVLKNYGVDDDSNVKLIEKLESNKKEFIQVQDQVGVLYNQYKEEKAKWDNDLATSEDKTKELTAVNQALENQLGTIKILTDPETDDEVKIKTAAEASAKLVIINRKLVYMDNLHERHKNEINKLRNQLLEETQLCERNVNKWKEANLQLTQKCEKLERAAMETIMFPEDVIKLQNDYDALLIKQRELQRTIDNVMGAGNNELEVLKKKVSLLESEKEELIQNCVSVKVEVMNGNDDELKKRLAKSEISETTERQRANHTNGLYELVKDQLAKSEERHKEYQKYNDELLQKNLALQESVKMLEDKVVHYVDGALFHAAQTERDRLVDECQRQTSEACALREEINVLRKDMATHSLWNNLDQYECHSLKHQIVDLQATGDDKAVIARLSTDVVLARMAEAEVRKKMDELNAELATTNREINLKTANSLKENEHLMSTIATLRRKNGHLESIIKQQRNHYLGYVPYTSQEKLVSKIGEILNEKKLVCETLTRTEQIEFDCRLIKETLQSKTDVLNELNQMIRDGDAQARALEKWFLDKTNIQLQELRCRRQTEFKEMQLKQAKARLKVQDDQIAQLETELLQTLCLSEGQENPFAQVNVEPNQNRNIQERKTKYLKISSTNVVEFPPDITCIDTENADTQTSANVSPTTPAILDGISDCSCSLLQTELNKQKEENRNCCEELQRSKQRLQELEMSISLLRQQMGDKQSQISFYEKHILEMQQTKLEAKEARNIEQLQQTLIEKERIVFELQFLLKKDRDEHSAAAARFQDEFKQLQAQLAQQQQEQVSEAKQGKPARAAVEFYIQQVHALEKHTAELQTSVSTLGTQLQASREECIRWRTLSNDRLQSVDELRVQLQEQHKNELQAYKDECEKWRSEVKTLQLYINAYKMDIVDLRPNIEKEIKDKDNKIHELLVTLRQLKTELRRKTNQPSTSLRNDENFEEIKEHFLKEQEVLKKRCEQLLGREKSAREEIRNLKGQLMKRPALSARSENTATKEQQQARKLLLLEKEVNELREKLEREVALNETHKARVSADFDKWSKFKHWQQTAEKTKVKLKEKTEECDKIQQTCSSYRMLIERLEREKHNLEVRIKNLKGNMTERIGMSSFPHGGGGDGFAMNTYSALEAENVKLTAEISTLKAKLEQQHHHSGALSSAVLQDKLEAQERKIAILEMSARGGGEIRAEMERIQNAHAGLQKANLRLEAENLDMRLDLEKSTNEVPHLREQIIYLENYIKLLKTTSSETDKPEATTVEDQSSETKRVSELERTVLVLKRVVEKLQVENKRLVNGTSRTATSSDRTGSGDRFKREYNRLKQQYDEKVDKITSLEKELNIANQKLSLLENSGNGHLSTVKEELDVVREQLQYKAELLEKVKMLLQRAAVKEKALLDQVSSLKAIVESKET